MLIRRYEPSDCEKMIALFYDTVHCVNSKDYTKEQLDVWATGQEKVEKWNPSFLAHYSLVAMEGELLIGYGDIDETGYLDRLYVHKDFQRRGVATAICNGLEQTIQEGKLVTHASITAKPFFEQRGYKVVREQQVERQGILLTNYVMEKEKRPKTLYVSDLDGTLLQSNERTFEFTNQIINGLVEKGMLFSYATARSYQTAHKVTAGLNAKIPLITYNGAMIVDNEDGTLMLKNIFGPDATKLLDDLIGNHVYPIVYALIDGEEKFSFVSTKCTPGMNKFLDSRQGDKRTNAVDKAENLYQGEIFYLTCIGDRQKLKPFYEKYRDKYHCVFQVELYTGEQWLEIMPKEASKANAIKQLKEYLKCDRLVAFGDGKNDMDMFEMADESYAVGNAVEELKRIATAVIGSNNDDGVARWLGENCEL